MKLEAPSLHVGLVPLIIAHEFVAVSTMGKHRSVSGAKLKFTCLCIALTAGRPVTHQQLGDMMSCDPHSEACACRELRRLGYMSLSRSGEGGRRGNIYQINLSRLRQQQEAA